MLVHVVFLVITFHHGCQGVPLPSPDFVSPWYIISLQQGGKSRIDIAHGLGETPIYVNVQVKSLNNPNKGFLFPALGLVPRDDDKATPHSGIVYLYNEKYVTLSAATRANDNIGTVIHTEQSKYWTGPNTQNDSTASVRVRAWKTASFPVPDFTTSGNPIGSNRKNKPGSAHSISNDDFAQNGYVLYGFDEDLVRVWTCSSRYCHIFTYDAYEFKEYFELGELEIIAWKTICMTTDHEMIIPLGRSDYFGNYEKFHVSYEFPGEISYNINLIHDTYDSLLLVWVESLDGVNKGLRFLGTGAMSYFEDGLVSPCSYGGLVYAYTNETVRFWKPGADINGKLICIPNNFAMGNYSQASNNGRAVIRVWTVFGSKAVETDCSDDVITSNQQDSDGKLVTILCPVLAVLTLLTLAAVVICCKHRPRQSASNIVSCKEITPQLKFSSQRARFGLHDL